MSKVFYIGSPYVCYIACPYTHPDPEIVEQRLKIAEQVVYNILTDLPCIFPFSPINYTHPFNNALTEEKWRDLDLIMLGVVDFMIVLCMPGTSESVGVKMEIDYCDEHGIPVSFVEPENVVAQIREWLEKQK